MEIDGHEEITGEEIDYDYDTLRDYYITERDENQKEINGSGFC